MSFKYQCTFLQNAITLYYPISYSSLSRAKNNFSHITHSSIHTLINAYSEVCCLQIRKTNDDRESECPLIQCFLFEKNCFKPVIIVSGMKAIVKLKTELLPSNSCSLFLFFRLGLIFKGSDNTCLMNTINFSFCLWNFEGHDILIFFTSA